MTIHYLMSYTYFQENLHLQFQKCVKCSEGNPEFWFNNQTKYHPKEGTSTLILTIVSR